MAMTTETAPPGAARGLERTFFALTGAGALAALIFFAAILGGLLSLRTLKLEAFPDISPALVQVFTEAEGLAAEEVEVFISRPVEIAMNGLPRVHQVRSVSTLGLSVVNVYFEDGTDIHFARQVVGERLAGARAALSGFGQPEMGPIATGLGQILFYILDAPEGAADGTDLRTLQDWTIKPELEAARGVAEALSLGGYERRYHVLLRPEALIAYDLTLADIIAAIEANNANAGAGFIVQNAEQLAVRVLGLADDAADLRAIALRTVDGTALRLGDIARIESGGAPRQGLVTMNGRGEVVSGLVLKLIGADSSATIRDVRARLDRLNAAMPEGVRAVAYYDQSVLIGRALSTMTTALWQGTLLVAMMLFVFMNGWRPALLVAASIPFSAGFALIAMQIFGISANLMSLGGIAIALGMMVDGALVLTQNAARRLEGTGPADRRAVAARAGAEFLKPLAFSILIVILVFMPILALQGVEGATFRPLAATVALAMTGSLVFALLVVPAALPFMVSHAGGGRRTRFWTALERRFAALAGFFIARRVAALGLAGAMLLAGIAVLPRLGSEFTPRLNEGDMLIRLTMAPSISLDEARETVLRFERLLLERFDEVDRVVTRLGRGEVGAHADPVNNAEALVTLRPGTARNQQALAARMSAVLESFPGVRFNITQPIAAATDELITGSRADIAVKLFGDDLAVLEERAEAIAAALRTVRGAADVQAGQIAGAPQLRIHIDRGAIARYGMSVADVLAAVQAGVGGVEAGQVMEQARGVPVVVRLEEDARASTGAIAGMTIRSPDGALVPLSALASVERGEGPRQITRENGARFIAIEANVRGRDIGSFVRDGQRALEQVALPPGYLTHWGGQFELQQQANARLAVVIPLTLGLVFLFLLAGFGRIKSVLLIAANIPLALVGGILALWITGQSLSVPATVGFIALFGVALGNGMVLVSLLDRLARQRSDIGRYCIEAATRRLRPVLMTAATTALGLTPLLFAMGVGSEVQRPLATVVTGGLVTSTIVTLLVIPSVYRWFAPASEERRVEA